MNAKNKHKPHTKKKLKFRENKHTVLTKKKKSKSPKSPGTAVPPQAVQALHKHLVIPQQSTKPSQIQELQI